jgi:hypothetical protein
VWKREAWKFYSHGVLLRPDLTMESMNNIGGRLHHEGRSVRHLLRDRDEFAEWNSRLWSLDCKCTMAISLFPKGSKKFVKAATFVHRPSGLGRIMTLRPSTPPRSFRRSCRPLLRLTEISTFEDRPLRSMNVVFGRQRQSLV